MRAARLFRLTSAGMIFLPALILARFSGAAAIKSIAVPAPSVKGSFMTTIVIPDSHAESSKKYPVIYLLHGYGGDHNTWPQIVPLGRSSDSLQVMFVCPDGKNCWYLDSPEGPSCRFETFFIKELLPFVDKNYRALPDMRGRAIVGFSMGGHGALTLLAKYPDKFLGACSIAGIMDLTEFPHEWELASVLGPCGRFRQRWLECSAISQTARFMGKSKTIILDCGAKDFALNGNRKEHALLQKAGVQHEYEEHPGSHDWRYVRQNAPEHVRFLAARLLPAR